MLSYVPAGWPPRQATSPSKPKQQQQPSSRPLKKSTSAESDAKAKVPLTFKMKCLLAANAKEQTDHPAKWRLRKKTPRKDTVTVHRTIEVIDDDVSGKDRLLAILAAEKALAVEALQASMAASPTSSPQPPPSTTTVLVGGGESSSSCSTISSEVVTSNGLKSSQNVFRRGVQSLRRSFRKAVKPKMLKSSLNPELSHDSGLGEDSDASHRTSPLIYNTGSSTVAGSPTTPTPILRPTRSFSSGSTSNPGLKHVMIREPSLRHLPSALRNSYPGAKKTQVVRLEVARHHLNRRSYMADNLVGDVGPQWGTLYFRASQEVRQCLKEGCDAKKSLICDLIFCPKRRTVEDKLMVMEAEEVDETINLLYKILYYDWLAAEPVSDQLPIILHCVQKFLVVVIEVCPELEANDRMRLSLYSKGLLKQCEDAKYQPLKECLARTRTLYIQVWCAILCVPFVP